MTELLWWHARMVPQDGDARHGYVTVLRAHTLDEARHKARELLAPGWTIVKVWEVKR